MTEGSLPVSVVIPTHNRADYLGEAIRSALAQPESGEVIVVDDGSTDATEAVIASFPEVRRIRTDNVERGAARNLGAREANCEYIAFLDSDDVWEAGKLSAQLRHLDRASVTGVRFIDSSGRPTGRTYVAPPSSLSDLPFENRFLAAPSSMLLPKAAFHEAGGFPEQRDVQGSEDWVFLNRLRAAGVEILVLPQLLTRYRVHAGNSIGQLEKVAVCMWNAADLIGASTGSDEIARRVKGRTAGTIARQFARRRRWNEARSWLGVARREGHPSQMLWATWAVAASGARGAFDRGERP